MHDRISVSQICFLSESLSAFIGHWRELDARRVSFVSYPLLEAGGLAEAKAALEAGDYKVETVTHPFLSRGSHLSRDRADWEAPREQLSRAIDAAAQLGARSIYMVTGGHGDLEWEEAAECFSAAIAPCIDQAQTADVQLMVENASHIMADVHIGHSLADTIRLAEIAGIGVCIDLFGCWGEAGLRDLIRRALPKCRMIQLSDYVYGDRCLPARAVPGDGAIPLERIIGWMLEAGYTGAFDLELTGPRIDAEGPLAAVRRAGDTVGRILTALGV